MDKKKTLSPSLESTVKPYRRTPLHPRRHERVADGCRLASTVPTSCSRESSWGATIGVLLCAAVACSAMNTDHKKTLHTLIYFLLYASSTRTRKLLVRAVRAEKKSTWSQYQKKQIQLRATTFSNLSNKVAPHRRHENCCRVASL